MIKLNYLTSPERQKLRPNTRPEALFQWHSVFLPVLTCMANGEKRKMPCCATNLRHNYCHIRWMGEAGGKLPASPALTEGYCLERVDERNELVLLRGAQGAIVVDHEVRLAIVPQYRVIPGQRLAVMH